MPARACKHRSEYDCVESFSLHKSARQRCWAATISLKGPGQRSQRHRRRASSRRLQPGTETNKKDEIKNLLHQQVTSPVRWEETIKNMIADGFDEFYEIGPGKVLQGLVKRINPDFCRNFSIPLY